MASESNSSRIAKNTFFLYLRSFFVLLVSLYTSRVVLRVLGVEDYGIYNVVGGIVGMLSFLNSSMAATYQRYYNFEMGKMNEKGLSDIFKSGLTVQLIYASIIVIIAESIGLWFLNTQLVIPSDRIIAAQWVFQISIISFVITVFQAPFTALIVANEKMNIFAIVSILDAVLKLAIVFLLTIINSDKLIVYATLLVIISLLNIFIYIVICKRKFAKICIISLNWDKDTLKQLFSFGGWGMMGTLAYTLQNQGINLLLNIFFGPIVNAARGITYQILNAVEMFVTSFQTSFRPQLTKSYAEGNLPYMYKLYYSATKISSFLLWALSLPIIIETPAILEIWLGDNVPEHTVEFTRLVLLISLVGVYANPTSCIAYATGKIKKFTIWVSTLNLMIVPIGYLFLKLGYDPESVMIINLLMAILVQIVRLFVLKRLIDLSLQKYFVEVILPTMAVFVLSPILPLGLKIMIDNDTFFVCLLTCFISVVSVTILTWIVGLNKNEKSLLLSKLTFLKRRFN